MKGLVDELKEEEIKVILKYILNSTDELHYKKILSNIFKELLEEQKKNIELLKECPKKYRVIINNTNRFMDIINEEMKGVNYE